MILASALLITNAMHQGLFLSGCLLAIGIVGFAFKRSSGKIGATVFFLAGIVGIILTFYMGSH